ncbi:NAD(P)/FAD-dependent oxidoreductase [Nocardia cyriacigeorgica]|uniref:NAD(P)/FAD-dependent oxidoreductase n=1 Tax=Nocardia cyriacigeorgica TaxID=135487 RepID=A0A6P1D141_9NOCA|nr:NAD(P)/FAD-dependent oxidoreductase [Nocardia cyriacigeorgica]NEW40556.1 NAD(P)/FAD-dependent oxidoreductase [Nocardia cyriacigeorgica]NEW42990.1 NAD(P)/FAD-dependent oxidoreductase [Nocardia cyriacigeorgica]NEW53287.1 NAD(P)/FAD-dependent oxidoreductase [Nocardia cyriacigeorgica]NEW55458.1 NAD(P)/FAD-dependent oxidoreductase [Nocardia cyriacigeorgica]
MAPQFDAIVVGAGFGGMGAGIELDRLGLSNFVILEREDDLGGTWHVNRYPGLAVDIASVTYSYSFEPNPYWSRLFAPGAELKKYAEHVADKYGLRRRMRFGTVVDGARWDEEEQQWVVSIAGGETLTGRYLLAATGFLSQPYTPPFPGIESFAGKIIHTTAWDDEVDLTDRKAAVIGTGATGVQLVPEVAKKVRELTVFQRTPIWVVPKVDAPIPAPVQKLFASAPVTQKAARLVNTSMLEALMVVGVLHFKQAKLMNKGAALLAKAHLRAQVRDPEIRKQLTPHYDFGCKRPTFSNHYFTTFNEPHVRLETNSIERIEPDGIVTADGHKTEIDTLILATGFNLWDVNFPAIEIIGRDGVNLGKFWRDNRFQAYEGITVPKFPNFLSLNSPYSYSGLSYFTTIEAQMKHMGRLFAELFRRGETTFEVTERANTEFLDRVTTKLDNSVFYGGDCATARSYYFNQHGEAALLRPTSTVNAHREAVSFPLDDYSYGHSA